MAKSKEHFGSKIGFILAAAGSAVGLGNIWRFPYLAAQDGGSIFLIIYIIFALTFGFSLMVTEISIGRKTGKSVIGAYKSINKKFSFLGILAALVPFIITPYYCVIGGWVLKYLYVFLTGSGAAAADDGSFFSGFISSPGAEPTVFFIVFVILTSVAVLTGVQKGIERLSKFMMPVLVFVIIGIAIYTLTLPDAFEGVKYYILPHFDGFTVTKLLKTIGDAVSQLFYSMSLAMGIMVTYGSYMRKEDSIEKSARQIGVFDTGIAFLAGLIIIPAVFVFSKGDVSQLNAGPSLMFITLPNVFQSMPAGKIVGTAFFFLVTLAALTSSISLLETIASIISEKFNLSRIVSSVISIGITIVIGMLSVLGYSRWADVKIIGMQFLDFFDFISNSVLMPIVALITCILIGYVVKTSFVEEEVLNGETKFKARGLYKVMTLVVCPVFMVVILVSQVIANETVIEFFKNLFA